MAASRKILQVNKGRSIGVVRPFASVVRLLLFCLE